MYHGFNLTLDESFFDNYEKLVELGEIHLWPNRRYTKKQLQDYLYKKNTIDGTKLMEDWFPEIKADIFISHSHADEELANALAGWLKSKFGLNVFIDSNVWRYSSRLLKKINDTYSDKEDDENYDCVYSYSKCNIASQHVNLMLSTALQKMIHKTECIIFLNTSNSVNEKVYNTDNVCINKTYSPWIYSEIICTQLIERINPRELKHSATRFDSCLYESEMPNFSYNFTLNHLAVLSPEDLKEWQYA